MRLSGVVRQHAGFESPQVSLCWRKSTVYDLKPSPHDLTIQRITQSSHEVDGNEVKLLFIPLADNSYLWHNHKFRKFIGSMKSYQDKNGLQRIKKPWPCRIISNMHAELLEIKFCYLFSYLPLGRRFCINFAMAMSIATLHMHMILWGQVFYVIKNFENCMQDTLRDQTGLIKCQPFE